jgi:hypothetical protein
LTKISIPVNQCEIVKRGLAGFPNRGLRVRTPLPAPNLFSEKFYACFLKTFLYT